MSGKPWLQLVFVLGEAVLSLLSNGVLFILISRIGGPELLGTYALAAAWLMLCQGVSSFGIPEYIMREVGSHGAEASTQVLHSLLLGLFSGALAMAVLLGGARLMNYPPEVVDAISVASIALAPVFLTTTARSVFLAMREMQMTFTALLVEVSILMIASVAMLLSHQSAAMLMSAFVASKLASAAVAMYFLWFRAMPKWPSLSGEILMRTAHTVFTFGLGNLLGMLTMRINTIMLSAWADIATVGQFAAATKIMEIGLIPPNLFAQLLMTRIAHSFNRQGERDPNRFKPWLRLLFAGILPICVGGFVFAQPILELLFGRSFGEASWVLRILMGYLLLESMDAVMGVILKAAHMQREDAKCLAFNPLCNILVNLALLPTLGVLGAAIGRLAGVVASTFSRNRAISSALAPIDWLSIAAKPAAISVGVGVVFGAMDHGRPILEALGFSVASALLMVFSSAFSIGAVKDMMSHEARDAARESAT